MSQGAYDVPTPPAPRSWLFVPATRAADWLPGAASSGADALIIDLEDAVPAANKQRARAELAELLARPRMQPCYVRVNATPALVWDDVATALAAGCDGIVIPKVEEPAFVEQVGAVVELAGNQAPATDSLVPVTPAPRRLEILALVESARGVLAAAEIARSHERVVGLGLGGEDLAADLGVTRTAGGRELRTARGLLVLAASAAKRWAVDTPCTRLDRSVLLRRECHLARQLGFGGKLAVHPGQVGTINACFAPTPDEVERARRIVRSFGHAQGGLDGVALVEGRMVDAAVLRTARRTLARATVKQDPADPGGTHEEDAG